MFAGEVAVVAVVAVARTCRQVESQLLNFQLAGWNLHPALL